MTDAADRRERSDRGKINDGESFAKAAQTIGPALLFGFRLWASVCLALYIAFWLQLETPSWAGTTAALVCQPRLGASLRKGWFRMIGTLIGGVAIVALTAVFSQERAGFLGGLALWGAACALTATLLRNFAAYAAALAGFTAAIIASDELGAVGGPNGQAFTLAISRVSEIWLGIVCAGIVLAGTDFGAAPRRLAGLIAGLSSEITARFGPTLADGGAGFVQTQATRRELTRRIIALDPAIDEAIGESSQLRFRSAVLQSAVEGLTDAIAGWRTAAVRLSRAPADDAMQRDAEAISRRLPSELRLDSGPRPWIDDPVGLRRRFALAIRGLIAMPTSNPSQSLLADETATVLIGLSYALDGIALLKNRPDRRVWRRRRRGLYVSDWAPALINAGRAFAAIAAVEIFWIVSAWPSGAGAVTWTTIVVTIFAPRDDQAYSQAISFMAGTGLAAGCAAVALFGVLPNFHTFVGFSLVMAAYLIPVSAMMTQPWRTSLFIPMTANFVPLVAPANQMNYDIVQFLNMALAIGVGCCAGALSFRLLPPLSPETRAARLLTLTLRDLRRLAAGMHSDRRRHWQGRAYSRLAALPDQAAPLQRSHLVAALSVGVQFIRLHRIAPRLGVEGELNTALSAFAEGDSATAIARLSELDQRLAAFTHPPHVSSIAMRARGRILALCDAFTQHRAYFDIEEAA